MPITIYPAIDIKDGKVVRLIQGDYTKKIEYSANPIEVAKTFLNAGATWLHIIDLDGAKTGKPKNLHIAEKITSTLPINVQLGGGIRSEETIKNILNMGISRVILGTKAIEDWDWFHKIVHNPEYKRKIVLSLDAREGKISAKGWTEQTDILATEIANKVSNWPLAAIVYTDIARDGMLIGPNITQLQAMIEATNIPIIASGGISSIEDINKLIKLPIEGIIIGRAIYEGKINLKELFALVNQNSS